MHILSLNTLLVLTIGLPLIAQATPRQDELICEEVAEAVNESVAYGYLTQDEADHISDNCYYYFLPYYA